MATATPVLPDDIDALKAMVSSMRVELTAAEARASAADALVAHLKQQIALLRRDKYGASAERSERLADQLELRLEELGADAGEDEVVAEQATPATDRVASFERKRPTRKPFRTHLPRERVVVPAPCACPACGGERLSKLGEGRDRDAGGDAAPVEGHSDGARAVLVSRLREDQPAASALPCRAAWLGRSQLSGDAAVRQPSRSTGRPSASLPKVCRSACRRSPTRWAQRPRR